MPRLLSLLLLLALLHPGPLPGLAQPAAAREAPLNHVPARLADGAVRLGCAYDPTVAEILAEASQERWTGWVRQLSGADPVLVGGKPVTITTRYSPSLFNGGSPAFDFVREQVAQWHPSEQIEEHSYPYGQSSTWKNLVLTIPGTSRADEVVLLVAHLDSTTFETPGLSAPGADDNATGSAALLEAARIMQGKHLPRTLRLIWFSGEEQGMRGSNAYAKTHDLSNVAGVINVDMIGYDSDNDRCFELHVGRLPASQAVGNCVATTIQAYDLDLRHEFRIENATPASDHSAFWTQEVGAVLLLENYKYDNGPNRCPGAQNPDVNPHYHQVTDTVDQLNLGYGFDVSRAALASAFSLASPVPFYIYVFPMVKSE